MSFTFFLTVIGWVIFRADNMSQAMDFITAMFSNQIGDISLTSGRFCLLGGVALLMIEWLQREKTHALELPVNKIFKYRAVRWGLYLFLVILIDRFAGVDQTFIYFQF